MIEYTYLCTENIKVTSIMGLNIKRVFTERGLKVKDIADKMGITAIGLSQHINGKPSVKVLENIAEAIGCDVIDFFDPKEKVTPTMKVQFTCPCCGKVYDIEIREHPQQPKAQEEAGQ